MAYDVEGYSGLGQEAQFDVQRRLQALLDGACGRAGLSPGEYEVQPQGDGGLALLPTGDKVDEPLLLASFLRAVTAELGGVNGPRDPGIRIRLRMALHEGVVYRADHGYVGDAVVEAFRMCDAGPVRDALRRNPAADLVLVAADRLYQDVLRHGHHGLPGDSFVRHLLRVKLFEAPGWLFVPGGDSGPAPVDERIPDAPSVTPVADTLDGDRPYDLW
ncbi:hypothetical protein [Streptomyces sp. NPDC059466]|uniref:hypothetical protein n=1 Tax=unclassified Streptomyces TaxID=2593676 RepID=UPI00367869F9